MKRCRFYWFHLYNNIVTVRKRNNIDFTFIYITFHSLTRNYTNKMQRQPSQRFYWHSQRLGATFYHTTRYTIIPNFKLCITPKFYLKNAQRSLVFSVFKAFSHSKLSLIAQQRSLTWCTKKPCLHRWHAFTARKAAFYSVMESWNSSFSRTFTTLIFS